MGLCLHASCGSAIGKARLRVYCQCAEMVKALEQVCIRPDVTECCVPHISHFAQVRLLKQLGMAKEALSAMESQTAAWQNMKMFSKSKAAAEGTRLDAMAA